MSNVIDLSGVEIGGGQLPAREAPYTVVIVNPEIVKTKDKDFDTNGKWNIKLVVTVIDIETNGKCRCRMWLEHTNPNAVGVGHKILKSMLGATKLNVDSFDMDNIKILHGKIADAIIKEGESFVGREGEQVTPTEANWFRSQSRKVMQKQYDAVLAYAKKLEENQYGNGNNTSNGNSGGQVASTANTVVQQDDMASNNQQVNTADEEYNDDIPF